MPDAALVWGPCQQMDRVGLQHPSLIFGFVHLSFISQYLSGVYPVPDAGNKPGK
jgi:hypothetical protein